MLGVNKRKKECIEKVEQVGDGLILYAQRGNLRIQPQSATIIRITYTERETFLENQGIGIVYKPEGIVWNYKEYDTYIEIKTTQVTLNVSKQTGSIEYFNQYGERVLAERESECRELEAFDARRVVIDSDMQVEEIETPDGVKKAIKASKTEVHKQLYRTKLHLNWQEDEKLYGLGQCEEGMLDLRGQVAYLHQANMKIAIPFLVSTKGYGILLATGSTAIFEDTVYGSYLYTEADDEMDYYVVIGESFDQIISGYRTLTGKASLLPRWAYGFLQSQERYETKEEILNIAKAYREQEIGIDGVILDWCSWEEGMWGQKTFDASRFPNPSDMMDQLHDMDVHFMISIWPNMNEQTDNFKAFKEANLLLPASNIYDAFNSHARDLYWKQAEEGLYRYGVDGWWCDASEPMTPEWSKRMKPHPANLYAEYVNEVGKFIPQELTNAYGLVHAQTIYEGQRSIDKEKRVVNLTRSTYVGGQRYGTILWSGDISATWETLRKQIIAGLNFCASGLPYWTLDIGAFFVKKGQQWFWDGDYDEGLADLGYRELFTRWYQYGAFLPIFRSHGTDVRREMWGFGDGKDPFYQAMVEANKLRYRLLPYIYSYAFKVWKEDKTFMRLLAFDFMEDRKALGIKDQYMFGEQMMVCPVTEPMYFERHSTEIVGHTKTRKVYFPKGYRWYDYYTDEVIDGGTEKEVYADIDRLPVYIREGSIIPMVEGIKSTKELDETQIIYHVYPGKDCTETVYYDRGDGYSYEQGEYHVDRLEWDESLRILKKNGEPIVQDLVKIHEVE